MLRFIYCQPLWCIVLVVLTAPVLWAILGRLLGVRHPRLWRRLNLVLAALSAMVILYATLGNRSGGLRQAILTPFASFAEAKVQPETYRTMLMNILLFEPLGLSLSQGLSCRRPWLRFLWTVLVALGLSCAIEILQYLFSLGRTEVDDIIMNTLGAMVGAISLPMTIWLHHFHPMSSAD